MSNAEQQSPHNETKENRVAFLVRIFKDVPLFGPLYVSWLSKRFAEDPSMLAAIDLEARKDVLRDLVRGEQFFNRTFGKNPARFKQHPFHAFGLEFSDDTITDETETEEISA